MNDTPETEAFIDALNDDWDVEFAALTTHAKRLERERNEARAERDEWIARFRADEQLIKEAMIPHHENPEI